MFNFLSRRLLRMFWSWCMSICASFPSLWVLSWLVDLLFRLMYSRFHFLILCCILENSSRVTVSMVWVDGLRLCLVGLKEPTGGRLTGSVWVESSVSVSIILFSDSDGDVVAWRVSVSKSSGICGGVCWMVSTSEIFSWGWLFSSGDT